MPALSSHPPSCSIALALYAQFGPGKFPGTWWIVFSCVAGYCVLTSLLHLYSWRCEGDAFVLTKPKVSTARSGHGVGGSG